MRYSFNPLYYSWDIPLTLRITHEISLLPFVLLMRYPFNPLLLLMAQYKKPKIMTIDATSEPITINNDPLEEVEDFTYIGNVLSKHNEAGKAIKARLSKPRAAFGKLQLIWKSSKYSLRTKIHLYNSNVKSVLLYGSECWLIIESDVKKVEVFHNSCLCKINGMFWRNKISNKDLLKKRKCKNIGGEIKQRRTRWLGHAMRMAPNRIPKVALHWTPPGKRKRGRPRTTWRRTITSELEDMGCSMGPTQYFTKNRGRWRQIVDALCPIGDEEDK